MRSVQGRAQVRLGGGGSLRAVPCTHPLGARAHTHTRTRARPRAAGRRANAHPKNMHLAVTQQLQQLQQPFLGGHVCRRCRLDLQDDVHGALDLFFLLPRLHGHKQVANGDACVVCGWGGGGGGRGAGGGGAGTAGSFSRACAASRSAWRALHERVCCNTSHRCAAACPQSRSHRRSVCRPCPARHRRTAAAAEGWALPPALPVTPPPLTRVTQLQRVGTALPPGARPARLAGRQAASCSCQRPLQHCSWLPALCCSR
jgi:hypothetical protein